MKNKFAVAMSVLIFNFSLPALADDAPQEIVITGQQPPPPPQYSSSAPVQTAVEMPKSSGDSQYSSEGYIKAKAEEAAAAEKGKKLQACYQQLVALDKSKYACSENGDLIDVVEVTGVKEAVPNSYAEQDAVRPEPIPNPADRPKPQMCYTLSQDLFNCEQRAFDDFTRNSSKCSYAQMMETGGSVIAGIPVVGDVVQSLAAAVAVGGAYLLGDCGNESADTTKGKALSLCAFESRENTAYCAKNWPN